MDATTRIEIFKPGTFTSMDGQSRTFSLADLQGAAAAYDAATDPSPIVIGHPDLDTPAYGWIDRLEMEGDRLVAVPTDVEPAFAEAVRTKRYRKVSASWYPPESRSNPKPGSLYLKHVGFFGAHPVAVKGLRHASFSEAQAADSFIIDEPTPDPIHVETEMADTPEAGSEELSFAERQSALEAGELALAEGRAEVARQKAEAEQIAQAARHDANLAFAERQIETGKLAPAGRDLVVGLMDQLGSTETISFGEANGTLTPVAAFRKLFDTAGTIVSFGEHAGREKVAANNGDASDIAQRALAYAAEEEKAGRTVSTAAAVRHVTAQAV